MSPSSTSTEACRAREVRADKKILPFPREIRLGLVMYGGVSLAVYINGVATEFYQAVQGTGIYALLKCLRNSEIVVDIISGASAGGINGILLGSALTGEKRDLEQTTALWRERGGISELLHRPGTTKPTSLFDGEKYYLPQLTECFKELAKQRGESKGIPSPIDALDLFVTGTDYYGKTWLWRDALDSSIQVKDHRSVFRLKYRRGRPKGNDFSSPDALAKLARITSSYPAALAPVAVDAVAGRDPSGADEYLTMWGQLTAGTRRHFIDGGVLDNKPFSDTIEQIYYRTAHLPVDRKLYFVEPDPETAVREAAKPPSPDILGVITRSLTTLPRYESIAGDLRQIDQLNRNVRQRADLFKALARFRNTDGFYEPPSPGQNHIYSLCRWQWLNNLVSAAADERAAKAAGDARRGADHLPKHPDVTDLPRSIDVEFSLRRQFHVTYRLYDALYKGKASLASQVGKQRVDEDVLKRGRYVLRALNRHIQLLKILEWAVEEAVERRVAIAKPGANIDADLVDALYFLLDCPSVPPTEKFADHARTDDYLSDCALNLLKRHLATRLVTLKNGPAPNSSHTTWLDSEAELAEMLLTDHGDCWEVGVGLLDYRAFATLDPHLYPLEVAAGIRENDEIETIRISASDAQLGFSGRSPENKVSGDALAHFGGFFKRTWRSNDILWGRLDARCQLIRGLLPPDDLKERVGAPRERAAIRANVEALAGIYGVDAGKLIETLFPAALPKDQGDVQAWLDGLISSDPATQAGRTADLLDTIVRVSQAEIVLSGVTEVERDAAEESKIWMAPDFAFPRGLDAAALARDPKKFDASYKVGDERLSRDVPPRVLLRIFAQGALILRDAVLGAADKRAKKKRRFLAKPLQLTRKVLGWPLHVVYWYATVTRWRAFRLGLAAIAATLFVMLLWMDRSLLGTTTNGVFELHWVNVGVFLGFPALVLAGELALGQMPRVVRHKRFWRTMLRWLRWLLVAMLRFALFGVPLAAFLWALVTGRYAGLADWFTEFGVREQLAVVAAPVVLVVVLFFVLGRLR